jgi:hypothetical protein
MLWVRRKIVESVAAADAGKVVSHEKKARFFHERNWEIGVSIPLRSRAGSPSCCSWQKSDCGSPHPPHQNAGVSDQSMPEKTAIDCRASLEFLPDTSAWLARDVTLAGRRRLSWHIEWSIRENGRIHI